MDIMELLNPVVETVNVFDATDEEIYNSAMEAKKPHESVVSKVSKDDDNEPVAPVTTHTEALQAALVLHKYTKDHNNPFAHKLELMLGQFSQRTQIEGIQSMKDSKITAYFAYKE